MKSEFFHLFFFLLALSLTAQEYPNRNITTNQFNDSRTFRTNVCSRFHKYRKGEINFADALSGLDLTVSLQDPNFYELTEGHLDESYPGLMGVLLDELAERANFTWRNSYAILDNPQDDKWTELLYWSVMTYDISAGWWSPNGERMGLGIAFPFLWYDSSLIMVGMKKNADTNNDDFWSFLDPFHPYLWLAIVATIFASGIGYYMLEQIDKNTDPLEYSVSTSILRTAFAFTGHFQFSPVTIPGQLFGFSLTFLFLIIISTYTANLASVLVVEKKSTDIQSLDQAVKLSQTLCIWNNTPSEKLVREGFPLAILEPKKKEVELYSGVRGISNKTCDLAITTVNTWRNFQDTDINEGCELEWVGRKINSNSAGFATIHDSGELCTSFINDVINYHFEAMRSDNRIDLAWDKHLKRKAKLTCSNEIVDPQSTLNSEKFYFSNLAGVFIIHFVIMFLALVMAYSKKHVRNTRLYQACWHHFDGVDQGYKRESVRHGAKILIKEKKGMIVADTERRGLENTLQMERKGSVHDSHRITTLDETLNNILSRQSNLEEFSKNLEQQVSLVIDMLKERKRDTEH